MKQISQLNRYSPLRLRSGRELKNRLVVPAMASATATESGIVTNETIANYQRLADSGAGLILVEYSYVHHSGRSEINQLGAHTDLHVSGLSEIGSVIKASGAMAGLQLTHSGAKTERALTRGHLMGPSKVVVPVKDKTLEAPQPMTIDEIELWKDGFVSAAQRASRAGFDLVEIHAAHGYGINQWISPYTNLRTDSYGVNGEGRSRMLLEIIDGIKSTVPHMLLSVRIPGSDFIEGGMTQKDALSLAMSLENHGVDLISVSSGLGGWRRPRDRVGQGYLVTEAAFIQKQISTPVIGVGGIECGEFIDELVGSETVALAAVGRAILKDPIAWKRKNFGFQDFLNAHEVAVR